MNGLNATNGVNGTNGTNGHSEVNNNNIFYQKQRVSRYKRAEILGNGRTFRGCTVWFTGLSGAGKTSIAFKVEEYLCRHKVFTYALDGDNIRHGLCADLGFSADDRTENIRRIAEVARLLADSGAVVLTSFISPFIKDREKARKIHCRENLPFFEIFVDTPLEVCERRDIKGLYARARAGQISGFTGIGMEYEQPLKADLILKAGKDSIEECVQKVIDLLVENKILSKEITEDICDLFIPCHLLNEYKILSKEIMSIDINELDLQWTQVLCEGWAPPLKGFMKEREYLQCLQFGLLIDESLHNQTIPIVLAIDDKNKDLLIDEKRVALKYNNNLVAILEDIEIYEHRKEERVATIFKTTNTGHPYIKMVMEMGNWLLGGDLKVFNRIKWNDGLDSYRMTPKEIRERLKQMKADAVFVFQLRNPLHNGHVLLIQDTRRQLLAKGYANPVLLLHPLGGWTKPDDVPLDVRIRQHKALLEEGVLNPNTTLLSIFPSPMLYAGPREVQWHAKARQVTGANFYIVGRDPAGLPHPDTGKDMYEPTHGTKVLQMAPGLGDLEIIPFRVAAYNTRLKRMAFFDKKYESDFEFISGTKMRNFAKNGLTPPQGFMAEKAWQVLAHFYQNKC